MKTKTCSKCSKRKPLKEFYKQKSAKDGLYPYCKECVKERYKANAEHIKGKAKEHYKDNSEEIKEQKREHYKTNPGKFKERIAKWRADNPQKAGKYRTKSWAKRKHIFHIKNNHLLSNCAWAVIKGIRKVSPKLERATGKPTREFRKRIFSQLKLGMTRENYGTVWEIDHKISKAILRYGSFKDPNFRKLWCLENLRPMWKTDNRKKGAKNEK